MRRIMVSIAICIACAAAVPALAQDDDNNRVNVGFKVGGFFLQNGDLRDIFDDGISFGAEVIEWIHSGIGLAVDVEYFKTSLSESGGTIDLTNIPAHVDLYYRFHSEESDYSPYLGAGATLLYANLKFKGSGMSASEGDWALGINVVGGLQWKKLFFEGRYYYAKPDFDMNEGINFGGLNAMVGIRF